MRICVVYDCLFPYTIGGAERWYRSLAERLAEAGHEVTYVTLRQWERGSRPDVPRVRVVSVGPRMRLYARGRRRIAPPLVFGLGVLGHLLWRGGRYDAVHMCAFPYFSVLAAAVARRLHGYELGVDWFEVWTLGYWQSYAGRLRGRVGWLVQRACVRARQTAFCFSRVHERRLRDEGFRGEPVVLDGLYAGPTRAAAPRPPEPVVVFAGRHIPEKGVGSLVPALLAARASVPDLRLEAYGDGPERERLLREIEAAGLRDVVTAPGFVSPERLEQALERALCLLLPSTREGYGLVVVEAAAKGVPSVVARAPDSSASELIENGVNGYVARSPRPDDLAEAIVAVHRAGPALRASTAEWFDRNAERRSIDASLDRIVAAYTAGRTAEPASPPAR